MIFSNHIHTTLRTFLPFNHTWFPHTAPDALISLFSWYLRVGNVSFHVLSGGDSEAPEGSAPALAEATGQPQQPREKDIILQKFQHFKSHWNNPQKAARVCILNPKRMTDRQNIHSELTKCPGNRTSYQVLPKPNILSPYDSAMAILVLHPKGLKTNVRMKICTWEFIATFFTIA